MVQVTDSTVLVDVDKAQAQVDADQQRALEKIDSPEATQIAQGVGATEVNLVHTQDAVQHNVDGRPKAESVVETALSRYFGSVKIDPDRYSRDIGNVIREVIDRLAGSGAKLDITIDIQAAKHEGFDESEIRTIRENARVLKFEAGSDFEKE